MKRFYYIIGAMFIVSAVIGLVIRFTYTDYNINDEDILSDYYVNSIFNMNELYSDGIDAEAEDGDNNDIIENEEWEQNGILEGLEAEGYDNISEEFVSDDEYFHVDTGDKETERRFFEEQEQILESAEYIVKIKGVSKKYVKYGTVIQECELLDVIKGDKSKIDTDFKLISKIECMTTSNSIENIFGVTNDKMEDECFMWGAYTNFLKEDKEYIVFMNGINPGDGYTFSDRFYLTDSFIWYFCLEDLENNVADADERVKYSCFKESEFFAADARSLEALLNFKEKMLQKYK